jgi:thiamine biosynthesis lipoprotein
MSIFITGITVITSSAQVFENSDEAFLNASTTKKKVLVIFSGSDWCAPCVQLDKTIISSTAFLDFAKDNLVIIKADFPQRKKLPKEKQAQNEALAAKYNPTGEFPEMVLIRSDQSVVAKLIYSNQSPEQFIYEITPYLSK